MFKSPRVNVIESDEGFSVEVQMTRLVYTEGPRQLYIDSEILASPGNISIWKESICNWLPPDADEPIDENKREAIINNVHSAFRWKGEWITVV